MPPALRRSFVFALDWALMGGHALMAPASVADGCRSVRCGVSGDLDAQLERTVKELSTPQQ